MFTKSRASIGKLAVAIALVGGVLASGCCKKGEQAGAGASAEATPGSPQANHQAVPVPAQLSIPKTGTSFTPPAGWEQEQKNEWTIVHIPPDASGNIEALISFVTFNRPGESTAKLGALSGVFGLNSIKWGEREFLELASGFPATGAGGTCKDSRGVPCEIHYLTINPGGSEQILFVYIVDGDKAEAHKQQAVAALKTLKKG